MATYIYGASVMKSPTNTSNYAADIIGKNSEVFAIGDILTMDGSHGLKVAGATDSVIGVSATSATMSSTNETVALVKPLYIPVDQDTEFFMGTNSDLSVLTSPTVYYKLVAGGTGAQQIDVSSGAQTTTNRVVVITKVDPDNLGGSGVGLSQCLAKFVKVYNVKSNT